MVCSITYGAFDMLISTILLLPPLGNVRGSIAIIRIMVYFLTQARLRKRAVGRAKEKRRP